MAKSGRSEEGEISGVPECLSALSACLRSPVRGDGALSAQRVPQKGVAMPLAATSVEWALKKQLLNTAAVTGTNDRR